MANERTSCDWLSGVAARPIAVGLALLVVLVWITTDVGFSPPPANGENADDLTRHFQRAEVLIAEPIEARLAWGTSVFLLIAATLALAGIVWKIARIRIVTNEPRDRIARIGAVAFPVLAGLVVGIWMSLTGDHLAPELVVAGWKSVQLANGATLASLTPFLNTLALVDLLLVMVGCAILIAPKRDASRGTLRELLDRHRLLRMLIVAGALCLVASVAEVYLLFALPASMAKGGDAASGQAVVQAESESSTATSGADEETTPATEPGAQPDGVSQAIESIAMQMATSAGICYSVFLLIEYWLVSSVLAAGMREEAPEALAASGRSRRRSKSGNTTNRGDEDSSAPSPSNRDVSEAQDLFAPLQVLQRLVVLLAPALATVVKALLEATQSIGS